MNCPKCGEELRLDSVDSRDEWSEGLYFCKTCDKDMVLRTEYQSLVEREYWVGHEETSKYGNELHVDLWGPDLPSSDVKKFVLGFMDAKFVNDIRISYDTERNGWKIEQDSRDEDHVDLEPEWKEVSFIGTKSHDKPKNKEDSSVPEMR